MNWEQLSSILRHILTFGGGFVVAKGWIAADTLPQVVGAIITLGGAVWAMVNKTPTSIISQAANLDSVQSIKLAPSAPAAVEVNTPNNVNK